MTILTIIIISFLSSNLLHTEPPAQQVSFKIQEDIILIKYLKDEVLGTKRLIQVFNEKGKKVFSTKTRKRELISELNMQQMKPGKYIIVTQIEEQEFRQEYIKE